jgi:hypothetical protein
MMRAKKTLKFDFMKKAHHPTKDLQMKAAPELKQKIESANQNLVQSL